MTRPRSEAWDVVVTCGGTGGHVLPALAVIDALCDAGFERSRIGFVGGRRGVETTSVPAAGVDFVGLPVVGFPRGRSLGAMFSAVKAILVMCWATVRAWFLMRRKRVRVVVAMGGYASLPCTLACGRRPLVVYESNSIPGIATRIAARRADFVGAAFGRLMTRTAAAVRVGFVVRSGFAGFAERRPALAARAREAYGISGEAGGHVVAVMGGSQGARSINDAVSDLMGKWRGRREVSLIHLVGRRDFAQTVARTAEVTGSTPSHIEGDDKIGLSPPGGPRYLAIAFEENMELVYAVADVIVCRSGASTCAELAATGMAAVCVPYPHAAEDHQARNAEELVEAGAALMIADKDVTAESIGALLDDLLQDANRLERMRQAAARLGAANGAKALAAEIIGRLDGLSSAASGREEQQ